MAPQESQLDRIEAKLDQVLHFRDTLLKLAMPRLPAPAREAALKILTAKSEIR